MREAASSRQAPPNRRLDLVAARQARGWTQETLATKVGVTARTISNWERAGRVPRSRRALLEQALEGDSTTYALATIATRHLVRELQRRIEAAGLP